jgi:ABC-2 type transport system permease protein
MRKVWVVFKREYLVRVRSKSFVIGTLGVMVFAIGAVLIPALWSQGQEKRPVRIVILDEVGGLAPEIRQALEMTNGGSRSSVRVVRTLESLRPEDDARLRIELRSQVSRGELEGYLVLPNDLLRGKAAEFHCQNSSGISTLTSSISQAVSNATIARQLKDRGIQVEKLKDVLQGVKVKLVKITKAEEVEEKGQTFVMAMIMATILYMTLVVYGMATMRSVMEEKNSRVAEVLVSSIRPFQLLSGKILGVAAVGFTQYLLWTVAGWLLVGYGALMAAAFSPSASIPKVQIPVSMLVYLVVFYLVGYFLYASLYAAAGAVVSSEEDAQQVQMPMTLTIAIGFVLFPVILGSPNSALSAALSLFPFFSPILMVLRIALQTPPFWQIALSIVLTLLTTLGVIRFSAKIYRVGILMYGKRPSLRELSRWLRYT